MGGITHGESGAVWSVLVRFLVSGGRGDREKFTSSGWRERSNERLLFVEILVLALGLKQAERRPTVEHIPAHSAEFQVGTRDTGGRMRA